jgi:hypothetical protein
VLQVEGRASPTTVVVPGVLVLTQALIGRIQPMDYNMEPLAHLTLLERAGREQIAPLRLASAAMGMAQAAAAVGETKEAQLLLAVVVAVYSGQTKREMGNTLT